ncbi:MULTISPECIES: potassium-transporting ATPase subunit C [Pseudonocardia]|uniref:Potassium-transporting ATPase KdpC subunit n=2 Tax=Pseudonocardia TaxID=1847 RepID=A0A1Y2N132_PSEAH|nr:MULTISPECIES: potassium-transporting ATPase subunit C [Pseudonocardia]OSY41194.1 Potassium-transporting ATPase C chain [Pseudonocardia autotrophica]TDN76650.1 K+-transporting ATPase ATPase C chain [Pseudonocardia autotrophica]BBG00650.1 potassium-transporting ATPase KdpC subunit [Pseudonocardia autotrophica]GEC27996.1 potassium-transporting ATPase KdpC subunit [Pseudonocardia saturnea]
MFAVLRRQTAAGLRLLLVMTLLCGVVYPLGIWAVAQLPGLVTAAEGSLLPGAGGPTGSALIGIDPVAADPAADPWFHTRPSASSADVLGPADTATSGGSNAGGFDEKLLADVTRRRELIAAREGTDPAAVPVDAVTASASGLDPDISPGYAALQVPRVARVTGLTPEVVTGLVARATDGRTFGVLGEPRVNVPELNAAVQDAAGTGDSGPGAPVARMVP